MISSAKEHYDSHLGNFYSWMSGDFSIQQEQQQHYFEKHGIKTNQVVHVIDLGAGHGVQSVSLEKLGFAVTAIDFNLQLLRELKENSKDLLITTVEDDIRNVHLYAYPPPAGIVCAGDTLTHLDSESEIIDLVDTCTDMVASGGFLYFSFRDYTQEAEGTSLSIPVKKENNRIHTCILEYHSTHVIVTDKLEELVNGQWVQKTSSYKKVRLSPTHVLEKLNEWNFNIVNNEIISGMTHIIARRP